ncbi:MAG TPA: hypothetical protein VK171_01370 [Fimbriimonas sp.]|nr:hypothetical protein [Fimbriimonas sp.]
MDLESRFNTFLSSGGTYFFLFAGWATLIFVFGKLSTGVAMKRGGEGEGCVLKVATAVMVLTGGALGLLVSSYPTYILTSLAGATILPLLIFLIFLRKKAIY